MPLSKPVVQLLSCKQGHLSDLIFTSDKKKLISSNIDKCWYKALSDAKITNFRFHDLRHTAASYLAMNGASLIEIADILGHKSFETTKRYAHLSSSHKTKLVNKVFGDVY
ncbi:site-specific integrase [Thalassotalea sp. PS06]|nr:site-specific integrase [Thalassotalea sp. PS06]